MPGLSNSVDIFALVHFADFFVDSADPLHVAGLHVLVPIFALNFHINFVVFIQHEVTFALSAKEIFDFIDFADLFFRPLRKLFRQAENLRVELNVLIV